MLGSKDLWVKFAETSSVMNVVVCCIFSLISSWLCDLWNVLWGQGAERCHKNEIVSLARLLRVISSVYPIETRLVAVRSHSHSVTFEIRSKKKKKRNKPQVWMLWSGLKHKSMWKHRALAAFSLTILISSQECSLKNPPSIRCCLVDLSHLVVRGNSPPWLLACISHLKNQSWNVFGSTI